MGLGRRPFLWEGGLTKTVTYIRFKGHQKLTEVSVLLIQYLSFQNTFGRKDNKLVCQPKELQQNSNPEGLFEPGDYVTGNWRPEARRLQETRRRDVRKTILTITLKMKFQFNATVGSYGN